MADVSTMRFAAMCGALSQPARLRIVQAAMEGGAEGTPAGDISRAVRCPPSTLSFHLKELTRCGLLRASQQGRYIRYAVLPPAFASLAAFIESLPQPAASPARVAAGESGRGRKRGRPARTAQAGPADEQLSMFKD